MLDSGTILDISEALRRTPLPYHWIDGRDQELYSGGGGW